MTKRQATKVQKATAAAETAADSVTALKDVRNVKRGSLANLREDLGSLQQKLNAHPLSQKVRDKKADIEVCRTDLEAIVSDLDDARARLDKALAKRDAVVAAVQKELAPPGDDSEDEDDDDEDD